MNINKLYEVALGYKCNMPDIDCNHNCNKCDDYLPNRFTAEKQLELIKFVGKLKEDDEIGIQYQKYNNLWFTCLRDTYDGSLNTWIHHKHFDQALAGLILELWDKLSSKQREEVRRILR